MTLHRLAGGRAALAMLAAAACALSNPPTDETPPHGGLPPGVSAAPPQTSAGPATSPTPVAPDLTPQPDRTPLGSFTRENTPRVTLDSTTRTLSARLDSVIAVASSDLTTLPLPAARGLVRALSSSLAESRTPRVRAVATELDTLGTLLAASPVDGRAVGRTLQRLAARAQAASPEAGVLAGRVARLADQLNDAGNKLAR